MTTILAIIWFLCVLIYDVHDDYRKWKNNTSVKHRPEFWLRALMLLPSIFLMSLPFPLDIWKILVITALESFTYLLFFDGWYNIKRGQSWWFLGTVDSDDSWWDKQQRKISLPLLKILKTGIPIVLLIIYVMILVHKNHIFAE